MKLDPKLIEDIKTNSNFQITGKVSQEEIELAEKTFREKGLNLPQSYKAWLLEIGGCYFRGNLIYSLQEWDDEFCTVPGEENILESVENLKENTLIEIFSYEGDEGYFFDTESTNELDYEVVYYDNIHCFKEPYANNFEDFLKKLNGQS